MATRTIFDYLGNEIGQLELPDNTSEEVWQSILAAHARAPQSAPIADVTPRQIRQALILSGISLADIDAALNSLPESTRSLAQIEWEYSVVFQRNKPLVESVATLLGWTSQQLDDLWIFAKSL